MPKNKNTTKKPWTDPDYAPELNREWFEKADLYQGSTLIRRGRPPKAIKKISIHLRIDPEIAQAFRATGKGWQTRAHQALKEWIKKHPR